MHQQHARGTFTFLGTAVIAGLALIVASMILRRLDPASGIRIPVALAPVPFFVWMLAVGVRYVKRMDELARRIQIEALATAFLGTAVLVVGWGQLQRVDVAPDENWGTVWAVMSFVYIAAYLVAWFRYHR